MLQISACAEGRAGCYASTEVYESKISVLVGCGLVQEMADLLSMMLKAHGHEQATRSNLQRNMNS